MFITINIE